MSRKIISFLLIVVLIFGAFGGLAVSAEELSPTKQLDNGYARVEFKNLNLREHITEVWIEGTIVDERDIWWDEPGNMYIPSSLFTLGNGKEHRIHVYYDNGDHDIHYYTPVLRMYPSPPSTVPAITTEWSGKSLLLKCDSSKYILSVSNIRFNGMMIGSFGEVLQLKDDNTIICLPDCFPNPGEYTLDISATGHKTTSLKVTVSVEKSGIISLNKSAFAPDESIIISYSAITAQMIKDGAFIACYASGVDHSAYGNFDYPDKVSGTLTLAAPDKAGKYEMRLYRQDYVYTDDTFVMSVPFTVSSVSDSSKPEGSMDNFLAKNTYKSGQFTDVNENAWYGFNNQKVIARAFEYGLMKGDSATTFNPSGNFTVAEAITVAARVHSIYMKGTETFVQGSPWYQVYIDYAAANGIMKSGDFTNYTAPATRAQMTYIFANALPSDCYKFRNPTTVKTPPDVTSSTPYYSSILSLYSAGIVGGSDDKGTFNPSNNITRAEVSAITTRLILIDTRLGAPSMPS